MQNFLRNRNFSKHMKVSSIGGGVALFRMVLNLVLSKVLAVYIGPSGFALLGQLRNGLSVFSSLSGGAINDGVRKYTSGTMKDKNQHDSYVVSAIQVALVNSILVTLFVLFYNKEISRYIFKEDRFESVITLFALTLVLFVMNNLLNAIVNGKKFFITTIKISFFNSIFSFVLTVFLVYFYGLKGAFVGFVLSQSIVVFSTVFIARKVTRQLFRLNLFKVNSAKYYKDLLHYAIVGLSITLIQPVASILIRNIIIEEVSLSAAGMWEGVNRVSVAYLGVFISAFGIYYMPELSSMRTKGKVIEMIKKTLLLVMSLSFVIGIGLFYVRDIVINILFTKEFIPMRDLFLFQFMGNTMKIGVWVFLSTLTAKAWLKHLLVLDLIFNFCYIFLSKFFISSYGIVGAVQSYFISYFGYFVVLFFVLSTKVKGIEG